MQSELILSKLKNSCIKCNKCLNSCLMLQGIGNDFYTLIACDKLKKGSLKCSLCGLCNEVCPINLDIKSYFKELKLEGRKPIMVRYAEKIHQRRLAKAYD